MCGIFGFAGFDKPDLLARMAEAVRHRGPDGEGYLSDGRFAMGMRRLAIIDLEGGDQPIWNEDETLAVCFNGEIYNYLELREELESLGAASAPARTPRSWCTPSSSGARTASAT